MQIAEIMSSGVKCVSPEASVAEAARKMREDDIGALPVEENGRLVGMVTDRDIVTRVLGNGIDAAKATVRDAMTEPVFHVFDDEDAEDAAKTMAEMQVRRMPVVNRDKRLVGIVSLGDLAEQLSAEVAGRTLEAVNETLGG